MRSGTQHDDAVPAVAGKSGNDVSVPLVVDVDGSLIHGDLLIEGAARLLARSPHYLFVLPLWLARGRAALKRRVAQAVSLPPETLMLNPAVTAEISAARAAGREVWLASAADALAVAPIAETVGAAGWTASDGRINLAGRAKANDLVERFGARGFDYVGNSRRDLPVWRQARRAIGVGLPAGLARKVRTLDAEARFLPGSDGRVPDWFAALRPHHWVKNVLVFAPLVAAHETGPELHLAALGVFTALSACASGTYLWNDLIDLPHDRRHPSKRHRPLAAGKLPLPLVAGLGVTLVAGGLTLGFLLSTAVGFCVLFYLVLTLVYSLWLKRGIFIDVIALAVLFTTRILAGAAAASIVLSPWFMAFSIFVFLALAIVKRQRELHALGKTGSHSATTGRAYTAADLSAMTALGAASGIASVVVLSLYVHSADVSERYARPEVLSLISLLLIYWLGRMTLLANRGAVDDDPVVFALRDRTSWLTGAGILAAFVVAL